MLIDSTIFIHYLRGNKKAKDFLEDPSQDLFTSVIVVMEIVIGLKRKGLVESFLLFLEKNNIQVVHISRNISRSAFDNFLKYHHQGLGIADSLIAACALSKTGKLATHNIKHFSMLKTLKLITPY
jgi:predicted nucleic acid-binding protein